LAWAICWSGGEAYHDDGPWKHPDDYNKFNGLVTYSRGRDAGGFSITARGYHGRWNSSDQIAENAVPLVGFFGTLNPADGGNSRHYSLQGEWHRSGANSVTNLMAYGFYYDLDLFSDFTYYLHDPVKGDQFEQQDRRWVAGLDARHTIFSQWRGRRVENTFGLQLRNDWVHNGLYRTENRVRTDKQDVLAPYPGEPNGYLPADTDVNKFTDTLGSFYVENKIQWANKFRSVVGLRGDEDKGVVTSFSDPRNSGSATKFMPGPKLSLIFGPWSKTEFYVQGGFSFHSNDVRDATQNYEPVAPDNPYPNTPSSKIPLLLQTKGAEVACAHWPCHICKAPFRSGISTVIPNCSRMATPEARFPQNSRATAMASNGRTTTRHGSIWLLILTWRTPVLVLPQ
jgi:hypothetical protein